MKKKLPIGISDFKKLIDGDFAYVDKTLFIEEIIEQGVEVALIPRPRRFGKTLNISMLRYFFEKTDEDVSYLFRNLNIWKLEKYRVMQGQYPVIFFSFRGLKHASWEEMSQAIHRLIEKEFHRHSYLLDGDFLSSKEKKYYNEILDNIASLTDLMRSLLDLTEFLQRYHKKKVIVLIDEYDNPIHTAYINDYYENAIRFFRIWFINGLKDNPFLERAVITGILHIAKENIFSGLNNIKTFTILHENFSDKFGLLEFEVEVLLKDYDLLDRLTEMRLWYDGYRMGTYRDLYNPWSVLNCIYEKGKLMAYWANTSDNALMTKLITEGLMDVQIEIEDLLNGKVIEKRITDNVIFSTLKDKPEVIWSLLLFSGYLTLDSDPLGTTCQLRIPNLEVKEIYTSMILDWFEASIKIKQYQNLLQYLTTGDIENFSVIFQNFLTSSASVFDMPQDASEKVYHALVLGMLIGLQETHEVRSNRESGLGRYDVMVIPKDPNQLAIVIEFKKIGSSDTTSLESVAQSALKQIEEKQYSKELVDRGIEHILYLGFAFQGKQVLIRSKFH